MRTTKRVVKCGVGALVVGTGFVLFMPLAWTLVFGGLVVLTTLAVFAPVAVRCGLGAMATTAVSAAIAPAVAEAVHVALMMLVAVVLLGPVGVLSLRAYQALRARTAGRPVVVFEAPATTDAPRVSAPLLRESA